MDIAWFELLQLDQCEGHGVWFDAGELGRAFSYEVGVEVIRKLEGRIWHARRSSKRR